MNDLTMPTATAIISEECCREYNGEVEEKHNRYIVTLKTGKFRHKYTVYAFCENEAIIIAQASAIKEARDYQVVDVRKVEAE